MRARTVILGLTLVASFAASARAVCTEATLEEGFRQADAVVRARAVAETRATDDEVSAPFRAYWGNYSPVMLHRLRVVEVFKGPRRATVNFFQEVDSGRFDVELGEEYLLFFHRHRPYPGSGAVIRGAMYVKHACGPSKLWREVTAAELARLRSFLRR